MKKEGFKVEYIEPRNLVFQNQQYIKFYKIYDGECKMTKVEQEITYVDHMGTDLTVVNSARVSFAKKHEAFDECNDKKLIKYLANNDHFSPFTHCSIQFHVKCPIFVARQFFRHTVGFCYNEMSERYANNSPEYFLARYLRQKDKNKKQGSKLEMIKNHAKYIKTMEDMTIHSIEVYNEIIEKGVAPELARMILPQNVMTRILLYGIIVWMGQIL